MAEKLHLADLPRLPIVLGTSCLTDPAGLTGYKTEYVVAGALVNIAAAVEAQTALLQRRHPAAPEEVTLVVTHQQAGFYQQAVAQWNERWRAEHPELLLQAECNERDYFTYLYLTGGPKVRPDHLMEVAWLARHLAAKVGYAVEGEEQEGGQADG